MKRRIMENGYFPSFQLAGVPVFIHWTFPAASIFLSLFLGRFELSHIIPLLYSYTILILVHEFGHAFGAWRAGMRVHKVTIDGGGGGWCYADEPYYFRELLLFYAGGIIAQLLLPLITVTLLYIVGNPTTTALNLLVFVFTFVNGFVILINIIPYGENDGKKIYRIIKIRRK